MKKIFFVRHAESEANVGSKTQFPHSINITERGKVQARNLSNKFPLSPDLIITTPFVRTMQTAQYLIDKFPEVPIKTWPLQEFTFLSPELCKDTTPKDRSPWVNEYWQKCDPNFIHGDGAESFNQFSDRIYSCLKGLFLSENMVIVVFTHGHVIRVIMQIINRQQTPPKISMKYYRDEMLKCPIPNVHVFEANTEGLKQIL